MTLRSANERRREEEDPLPPPLPLLILYRCGRERMVCGLSHARERQTNTQFSFNSSLYLYLNTVWRCLTLTLVFLSVTFSLLHSYFRLRGRLLPYQSNPIQPDPTLSSTNGFRLS